MTAIVGLFCTDGVVIGSDSAASMADGMGHTIEQPVRKVHVIDDTYLLAGTGSRGLGQRIMQLILEKKNELKSANGHIDLGKRLSSFGIKDFVDTHIQPHSHHGFGYGCLVGFYKGKGVHLLELGTRDFQPEFLGGEAPFCTMGSGQRITDPFMAFLRKHYFASGPPTVKEGKLYVALTLQHVIDLNTGGVNGPLQIGVMENTGATSKATLLAPAQLTELETSLAEWDKHLEKFGKEAAAAAPIPNPA